MNTKDPAETKPILSEEIKRDYHVIKRLGRGGMGDVYLAEQVRVGRRLVALKVLNQSWADNLEVVKRFEAEAATAGLIHHRNVVTIYDSRLTDDGQIYVAMEFVAGQTLRELMAERKRLPLEEVVEIAKQVCAGLAAAHKLGIVHRDIKPDNIMLVEEENGSMVVKLLDFGIARLSESQSANVTTKPGLILGTPAYMSPEQAAGSIGDQIDARSDIYSLAIVVYEMLTGRVIFEGETWMAILRQHLYDPPSPPSQFCEGDYIPPAVDRVIMNALAKDRGQRPQNAAEFARALEEACREAQGAAAAPTARNPRVKGGLISSDASQDDKATRPLSDASIRRQSAERNEGIGHAGPRKLGLVLAAVVACAMLGWAGWMWRKANPEIVIQPQPAPSPAAPSPVSAPSAILKDLLSYRVRLEGSRSGLITLPLDLTVRSREEIFFQFKLTQPGAVYLLEELKDGSWRWFDATASGQAPVRPAGKWTDLPREHYYTLNDEVGVEKFRVIYVPEHLRWSLAEAIAPARVEISRDEKFEGSAVIQPDAVNRALARLNADGVQPEAEGSQNGNAVEYRLRQRGDELRAAHYQITLNHIARK
jgi:serine/threonine protein kinase